MPEDRVPRYPLPDAHHKRPRDDTLLRTASWLGVCFTVLGGLTIVWFFVQEMVIGGASLAATPAVIAPPPIDEAKLARAITIGVAAAIGSPQPLRGEIVMLEPTRTPAPAVPTPVPTSGPMPCPDDPYVLPAGTICRGLFLQPTPTPIPACLTPPEPSVVCQVRPGETFATPPIDMPEGDAR